MGRTKLARVGRDRQEHVGSDSAGLCEQHGHHLPLFVDSMQVTEIAQRAEKMLGGKMLLVPTLWLGSSHHHKEFAGTISMRLSLYGVPASASCFSSTATAATACRGCRWRARWANWPRRTTVRMTCTWRYRVGGKLPPT